MAVIRVEKNKNYSAVSNIPLKDKGLSLKAKGLLMVMLALPDDWEYSIAGLTRICKEGKDAIMSALHELAEHGYVEMNKVRDERGRFDTEYVVSEVPMQEDQCGKSESENPPQLNTYILSTKEPSTKEPSTKQNTLYNPPISPLEDSEEKPKEKKHKYGEYNHVKLTDTEFQKLCNEYGEVTTTRAIENVDRYKEETGKKYRNDYLVIRRWGIESAQRDIAKEQPSPSTGNDIVMDDEFWRNV